MPRFDRLELVTRSLADALRHNTRVQTLWLAENAMIDEDVEALADTLNVQCSSGGGSNKQTMIRQAILSVNGIGPAGAKSLASVLDNDDSLLDVLVQ
jgi:hypothetical protein